jgi:hypothetical protein
MHELHSVEREEMIQGTLNVIVLHAPVLPYCPERTKEKLITQYLYVFPGQFQRSCTVLAAA